MLFCTRINLLTISHTTTHFLTHSISLSSKQPQQNQIRLTPTSSSVQISITTIHPMRSVTSKTEKSTLSLRTRVVSQLDIRLQFLVYILTVAILNVVAALKYFQWTIIHFHISNVKVLAMALSPCCEKLMRYIFRIARVAQLQYTPRKCRRNQVSYSRLWSQGYRS